MATSGANVLRSFKTVFIPADKSRPIEEWTIEYNNASEVSCLLDRLKAHFAGAGSAADKESLRTAVRAQIKATLEKQNPEAAKKPIDDAMVDIILQMSAVDCVALQNNKHSTGYIGLMLYVDDQGKAKQLPLNERATRVTIECGCPTSVLGDCVIARNFDDENNFRRVDFTLEEFSTQQQWRVDAQKANKEKDGQGDKTKELQALLAKQKAAAGANAPQVVTSPGEMAAMIDAAAKRLEGGSSAAAASAPTTKTCSNPACERDASMRCGRCKRSSYCSVECQKKDFKFHKANVCIPKDAAAAPAEQKAQ